MSKKRTINKREIIGFCGAMGSGKSTKASRYTFFNNYSQKNFADPVRTLAWKILNWEPSNTSEYEEFKSLPVAVIYIFKTVNVEDSFLKAILFIMCCHLFRNTLKGRDFLQRLGNEARETINLDVWVLAWETSIANLNKVVVADVRYENEIRKILALGGKIIFCNYKSDRYFLDTHPSERIANELIGKGFKHEDDVTDYFIKKFGLK